MATVKKSVETKKPTPKSTLKPLRKFQKYDVQKREGDDEYIYFGCGAVVVKADDLKAAAKYIRKVKKIEKIKEFYSQLQHHNHINVDYVVKRSNEIRKILDFLDKHPGFESVISLKEAASTYRTLDQILSIPPETLERLALVADKKK